MVIIQMHWKKSPKKSSVICTIWTQIWDLECFCFKISIKRTSAVHMTYNKETAPPGCSLPIDVRSLFRMVSLVKPDFSLILKAKCAAMGFRAPSVLGARLKTLTELAKDELWVLLIFSPVHFELTNEVNKWGDVCSTGKCQMIETEKRPEVTRVGREGNGISIR